jgi:hypothetical protein
VHVVRARRKDEQVTLALQRLRAPRGSVDSTAILSFFGAGAALAEVEPR